MIIRATLLTLFLIKFILGVMEAQYPDTEELQRHVDESLLQIQKKLLLHSDIISQMSHQINELTLHVSDLEYTKEDLLNKVHILETQLSCVMTSHSETCSFSEECLNRGTLTPDGSCNCNKGYTGTKCERDVDECQHDPCQNNGRCENTIGSFTCICTLDFYGLLCSERYDDCSPNPCNNGDCLSLDRRKKGVPHFHCNCPGWTSNNDNEACAQDVDECMNMNDYCAFDTVHCENTPGSYHCTCPNGYFGSGKLSEGGCFLVQDCSSDPCDHGKCHDLDIGYKCECDKGWTGRTCNVQHWCNYNPCLNGGDCIEDGENFICECQGGFGGKYCELCDGVKCHGQCVSQDGEAHSCQKSSVECVENTCQNGGACSTVGMETCACLPGYEGTLCQDKVIYELSTCGTQGPTGPSHYECALYYTDHDNVDVDSGIQKVYIEDSGVYRVSARGSSGGSCKTYHQAGGYPAEITMTLSIKQGSYFNVAVGQEGACYNFSDDLQGKKSKSVACGGGGGTFVVTEDGEPIVVAGGGGGAGDNGPGLNASEMESGTYYHSLNSDMFGGSEGSGGKTCSSFGGGAGAGFFAAGEDGFSYGNEIQETGGRPWPDLRGGMGVKTTKTDYGRTAYGGFGGGGRGTWSPGGGGGYSGGAGKCSRTGKGTAHKGGGGGGSFVTSDALSRSITISSTSGPGHVQIVHLGNE